MMSICSNCNLGYIPPNDNFDGDINKYAHKYNHDHRDANRNLCHFILLNLKNSSTTVNYFQQKANILGV